MALKLPSPLRFFFSHFPLYSHPAVPNPNKTRLTTPTIWIQPPPGALPTPATGPDVGVLSADMECLKWQAYIALRGVSGVHIRWDVQPEGALDGRLPNLHVPKEGKEGGELLAAQFIPTWVDSRVGASEGDLEGYKDEAARDESRAWVSLLESTVHAALILSQPRPSYFKDLLDSSDTEVVHPLQALVVPPPAPLTGFASLFPPSGARVSQSTIEAQYRDAVVALSERLGTDTWFLGSSNPTPLDALAFAYLHALLNSKDDVRIEVTRRVNLVAWEWRVRGLVRAAFTLDLPGLAQ
ncbi:hypothetical protein AX16_008797 [Volvariella volvacea WC 439]|nr:hypothetical protein AX16_008797 [Volvariella volvacea WC 439]